MTSSSEAGACLPPLPAQEDGEGPWPLPSWKPRRAARDPGECHLTALAHAPRLGAWPGALGLSSPALTCAYSRLFLPAAGLLLAHPASFPLNARASDFGYVPSPFLTGGVQGGDCPQFWRRSTPTWHGPLATPTAAAGERADSGGRRKPEAVRCLDLRHGRPVIGPRPGHLQLSDRGPNIYLL